MTYYEEFLMVPHMDNYFEMYMSLQCEVKALKQTIKEFQSGKRYLKLQADQHRVIAGFVKEIKKLRLERKRQIIGVYRKETTSDKI